MRRTTKVAAGLFAAWVLNDLEELWTMPASSRDVLQRVPRLVPLPETLRREGVSARHCAVAITMMGAVMAAASVEGARTRGRSRWFRGVLLGFGIHGFGHLASSAVRRGYTSGVATAPTVVIPYWWWARRELAKEGIGGLDRRTLAVAAAGVPLTIGVHALTYRLLEE